MSYSMFSRKRSSADRQHGDPQFDGDWFGAEAWVVAAGLVDRHDEKDRRALREDAAGDWRPL